MDTFHAHKPPGLLQDFWSDAHLAGGSHVRRIARAGTGLMVVAVNRGGEAV